MDYGDAWRQHLRDASGNARFALREAFRAVKDVHTAFLPEAIATADKTVHGVL